MKKAWLTLAFLLLSLSLLAACGAKDEEQVVGELSERLESLAGYRAEIDLTLKAGQEDQAYRVEVWHQAPQYYRISLTSKERDITQIILKNDDGVFVLTPHLNKSFRFQSSWPGNQPQVYLYESLIRDIISDSERKFSLDEEYYVFDTAANYQNKTLQHQRIWLDKELKPVKVHIMDADFNVMVELLFTHVELDSTFEEGAFDVERNMQGTKQDDQPTAAKDEGESEGKERSIGTLYPAYQPPNVELVEEKEVKEDGKTKVVLRYSGDYHFTIIQERAEAQMVTIPQGDLIDLGFTMAIFTGKSLLWTYDGIDFWISGDLPQEEMIAVAQSLVGQADK